MRDRVEGRRVQFSVVLGGCSLLGAVASLRPHVVTVGAAEPLLEALGIVRRESRDLFAVAAWARFPRFFRIFGTRTVRHAGNLRSGTMDQVRPAIKGVAKMPAN